MANYYSICKQFITIYYFLEMNELIIEELRYDLEEKIRQLLAESKDKCYIDNKATMEGSRKYMECVLEKQKQIQNL